MADPDRAVAPPERPRLRVRLLSIRARSTVVAVVVVGAALTLGALALLSLLQSSLEEGVESTAEAQVSNVIALLRLGPLPSQLPVGRGDIFTQIVGPRERVLAATPTLLPDRPISTRHPGEEGIVIRVLPLLSTPDEDGGGADADGPYLLLSRQMTARTAGGAAMPVTVYVAGSLRAEVEARSTVAVDLALGLPMLVVLVGLLVWALTGRSLRPVEAVRAEVADISLHDLHRRVPVPAARDEVGRLARTMNAMLDRLESSSAVQRRFVADASHELRSPLAALQATLEVALAHPDDSAWQDSAEDALDEARRLHRLVDDLLVLARADEPGTAPARNMLVDLDEIVFREARLAGPSTAIAIDLHRVSAGRVRGDGSELTRVVHNLLDNARRHAQAKVTVELSELGDEVLLAVGDDGPGVPEAERSRIFDRFARLDEARNEDDGGTGLGLAIVREIVESHHGTVEVVDSRRGARFEVRLPSGEMEA